MIDEIYRTKQGDGYLSFDEIADGLVRELGGIYEEIYPGAGERLVDIFLVQGHITGTDWDGDPGMLILQGFGDDITITDPVIIGCINILAVLAQIRRWHADYSADRAWMHLVGFSQAVVELRSQKSSIKAQYESTPGAGMVDVRRLLSIYGAAGAAKKHQLARELKEWALNEAKAMRGSHMDIARRLAALVPERLDKGSKNHQRLIYDALRSEK